MIDKGSYDTKYWTKALVYIGDFLQKHFKNLIFF